MFCNVLGDDLMVIGLYGVLWGNIKETNVALDVEYLAQEWNWGLNMLSLALLKCLQIHCCFIFPIRRKSKNVSLDYVTLKLVWNIKFIQIFAYITNKTKQFFFFW